MMSSSNRGWKQTVSSGLRYAAILCLTASMGVAAYAQAVRPVPSAIKTAGTGSAGFNNDFGPASGVELNAPSTNLFDAQGNQYISDAGNNCVRKVDLSGSVTTIVGLDQAGPGDTCNSSLNPTPTAAQGLLSPSGLAIDAGGTLYVADTGHNCVRKLAGGTAGVITAVTAVGDCSAASVSPAPFGLVIDEAGNLYVSTHDAGTGVNQVIKHRPGDSASTVCRVAGATSALVPTACSAGTLPTLNSPAGLAFDPEGNLFIADTGNKCVREVTPAGVFSTPVGLCTNDGSGSNATNPANPIGLAFSQSGRLFITSSSPSNVFELAGPGTLNIIAGLTTGASAPYSPSQDGSPAVIVPLSSPEGLAVDPAGDVSVVDTQNNVVRRLAAGIRFPLIAVGNTSPAQTLFFEILAPANLTAAVGADYKIISNSCSGSLTPSVSSTPTTCGVSLAFGPTYPGERNFPLMLSDAIASKKYTVGLSGTGVGAQAIFPPGIINTLIGSLSNPTAVRLDALGNIYLAEAGTSGNGDVKFIPAGSSTASMLIAPGAGLTTPSALALDAAGNLYIADQGANVVFKYDVNGVLTTYASGLDTPTALALDDFDNLYIAQAGAAHSVVEVFAGSQQILIAGTGPTANANGVLAIRAKFVSPSGLVIDNNGILYISDSGGHRVYSVDTGGRIHFLVGNGTTTDTAPGTPLGTALQDPRDLAVDPAGDVYIADGSGNRSILVYSGSQQNPGVTTLAGTGAAGYSGDGGPSNLALLNNPLSLALDGKANLYIVDAGNQALRDITYINPKLDFGKVKKGEISPTLSVTLWNTGNTNLNQIAAILLSDTTNFTLISSGNGCGTTVILGATCDYQFQFNPTTIGPISGTATLTDNANPPTQVITLTGIGTDPNSGGTTPSTISTTTYVGTYGTPYTWTAGVIGDGTHAPTGTLTFIVNGNPLCPPAALDGSGHAGCSPPPTGLSVASYTLTINYSGDGFYAPQSVTAPAQILPAHVTITANSFTRPYGQANPVFTGTITGVVTGETITATYTTTATQFSPPGVYPITPAAVAGPGTSLSNYVITLVPGTLTITQAGAVTITVNNVSRIYGVPNPTFTSTIINGAAGDTITVTYSTTATLTSPPGNYPITAALSGASAGNYSGATVVPGVLTVTKAPTTLALTSSNAAPIVGTSITFSAHVTSPSTIIPDGAVTFTDGATVLGVVTLDAAGNATLTTSALTAGSHTITATYPGTVDFLGSSASLTQNVLPPAPVGNFTLSATPAYQEVKGAGSNVYQITVTSVQGFVGPVTLTCAGLAADANCAFSPATVTLTAGGTAQVTLTTTTTLNDALAAVELPPPGGKGVLPLLAWTMFPMQLSGAATLFAGGLRRRKKESIWKRLLFLLPIVLLVLGISGCGCTVTQFHTYTITITGAATSSGAPLTQATTVSLTVIQ
jgi:sugar lactone lactonase YvrE